MISPLLGQVTLGIYAALLAVGGVMGFVKARSKASLVSGLLSAVAALVALRFSTLRKPYLGFPLGMALAIALFLLFGYRYAAKNRKFMPSGLLAIVSLIVLGVMIVVMDWSLPPGS